MKIRLYKLLFMFSFLCMLGAVGSIEIGVITLGKGFMLAIFWLIVFTFSLYKMDNK